MRDTLLFAVIASSGLVIGGATGAYWHAPERMTGVMLAFASGTLISALAFEHGKPLNSFATAAGFLLSFVLAGG